MERRGTIGTYSRGNAGVGIGLTQHKHHPLSLRLGLRDVFVIQVLDGEKRYYRYILKGQCGRRYWSNSTHTPPLFLKIRV